MKLNEETLNALMPMVSQHGFFGFVTIIFLIFGMKHVPAIITAVGKIMNERHKTNLLHKRSMSKIENQLKPDKTNE